MRNKGTGPNMVYKTKKGNKKENKRGFKSEDVRMRGKNFSSEKLFEKAL